VARARIETVFKQRVTTTLREGSAIARRRSAHRPWSRSIPRRRRMLTGDENLIDVDFVVQYRIQRPA
jgi:regulator of protease activity HflC (stomatin/prohibitin superfamily)